MSTRGMGYKRTMRNKHIKRKSEIVKSTWIDGAKCLEDETFMGSLDKGKVHCSCKLCSSKTKINGFKPRDKRELQRFDDDMY